MVAHLLKWFQRCPLAGCSYVSAYEEGCMYHSSSHLLMDLWATCKNKRKSGWVLGAVGEQRPISCSLLLTSFYVSFFFFFFFNRWRKYNLHKLMRCSYLLICSTMLDELYVATGKTGVQLHFLAYREVGSVCQHNWLNFSPGQQTLPDVPADTDMHQ